MTAMPIAYSEVLSVLRLTHIYLEGDLDVDAVLVDLAIFDGHGLLAYVGAFDVADTLRGLFHCGGDGVFKTIGALSKDFDYLQNICHDRGGFVDGTRPGFT